MPPRVSTPVARPGSDANAAVRHPESGSDASNVNDPRTLTRAAVGGTKSARQHGPDVRSANVSWPDGTAQVSTGPETPFDALTAAVTELGYRIGLAETAPAGMERQLLEVALDALAEVHNPVKRSGRRLQTAIIGTGDT
ncbi:MAG: hypothetical protein H0T88_04825 [Lysobacter sp.]|nr:hypothetical protein [Lysobacter sp.]